MTQGPIRLPSMVADVGDRGAQVLRFRQRLAANSVVRSVFIHQAGKTDHAETRNSPPTTEVAS